MNRKADKVYAMLSNFNSDTVATFLNENNYETDCLDFKESWIEKGKLAKIILAMANSGGGIIVFGIKENDDNTTQACGLEELKDETQVRNSIKKYIPEALVFKLENYSFDSSEYEKLKGKKFQLIIVDNIPEQLPFISTCEGENLQKNCVYVRTGTSCELADNHSMQQLIDRRIKTGVISKMELREQLYQLKTLYDFTNNKTPVGALANIASWFIPKECEEYSQYIDELIDKKKILIEKDLGIY